MIKYEPSEKFMSVEDVIKEAIEKAKATGETYWFDCNGYSMTINAKSDDQELLANYWEFKHEEGVANGTIQTFKVPL